MQDVSDVALVPELRLISNEATDYWHRSKNFRPRLLERIGENWANLSLPKNYLEAAKKFRSTTDFLLCYAFDVFRRGWQYQKRAHAAGTVYVPHYLRNEALEVRNDAWDSVSEEARRYWSWGNYIVEVLDEDGFRHFRTPEGLQEIIGHLIGAIKSTRCPTWMDIPSKANLPQATRATIVDILESTARAAKLPLLWRKDFLNSRVCGGLSIAEDALSIYHKAGVLIHATRLVYAAVHSLRPAFDNHIAGVEMKIREVSKPVLRCLLTRRGLFGSSLKAP
jgi:hypothetical protein